MRVCAMLAPLAPVGLLVLTTVIRHASETGPTGPLGRAGEEAYESNWSLAYDLWAHQFFGLSPLSAAGIVSAVALAGFAAARAGAIIPMFSPWALVSLGAIYWFFPLNLPGFGFVSERALPLMWAWALVRVPARVPRWLGALLAAASFAWAIGLAADLFRASHDLDDFTAAAPALPEGSRLLTLNFEPRVSARNTWSLLHASGMYTLLRQATPQDVWADSPSMPIRRARPPAFVEDPVAVREFLYVANTPQAYCAAMVKAKLPDAQCQSQWSEAWAGFWNEARDRYDHVLLWGASPDVISTMPAAYVPRFVRGRLELFARRGPI